MEIRVLSPAQQAVFDTEILNLLYLGEREFVPPLSARSSTTQSRFTNTSDSADGVRLYFEEMKKQCLLVATENGALLGFVSFRENYISDVIQEQHLPNVYISTLLVSPAARGRGLTRRMYETLFTHFAGRTILTRTWSTNTAHIHILEGFGFETFHTIKNDRGEGVDTVYFIKRA